MVNCEYNEKEYYKLVLFFIIFIYMLNINNSFQTIFLLLCDNLFLVGKNKIVKII